MHEDIVKISTKFNSFLNELNEINNKETKSILIGNLSPGKTLNMVTKMYSNKKNDGDFELPERVYLKRNSLLTEMLRISHFRTIRHIFISIMIILALQVIYIDSSDQRRYI